MNPILEDSSDGWMHGVALLGGCLLAGLLAIVALFCVVLSGYKEPKL